MIKNEQRNHTDHVVYECSHHGALIDLNVSKTVLAKYGKQGCRTRPDVSSVDKSVVSMRGCSVAVHFHVGPVLPHGGHCTRDRIQYSGGEAQAKHLERQSSVP